MSESEFLLLAEGVLRKIQTSLEQVADETDIDLECARSGNVLQVEFPDNDAKIIINTHVFINLTSFFGGHFFKIQITE
jgi:CyaY protein